MKRPRDTQRSKLYAAEREAFGQPKEELSLDTTVAFVRQVWRSPWTARKFQIARYSEPPYVADGRGTTAARGSLRRLNLPRWSRNKVVILHELAHALTWHRETFAAHGREFAAVFLELVSHWLGVDAAKRLRAAFRAKRVRYRPKRQLTPEQREALRERGKALARKVPVQTEPIVVEPARAAAAQPSRRRRECRVDFNPPGARRRFNPPRRTP